MGIWTSLDLVSAELKEKREKLYGVTVPTGEGEQLWDDVGVLAATRQKGRKKFGKRIPPKKSGRSPFSRLVLGTFCRGGAVPRLGNEVTKNCKTRRENPI